MTTKRLNEKPFYYNHVINDFIVDTLHIDVEHKYAYLTLIWEAHRSRGILKPQTLDMVFKRNKDIHIDTYWDVLNEFWNEDEDGSYSNDRVTTDLHKTLQHKESSSKGGKTSSLDKMIDSDQRQDEYNQIHDAYPSKKRVAKKEGLALYCKQLQSDKRFTFKRVLEVVKGLNREPQYYPLLATLLRDTEGKYWKVEQEKPKVDRVVIANKLAKQDSNFYNLTKEEQNERINSCTE